MSDSPIDYDFYRNNTDLQSLAPLGWWIAAIVGIAAILGGLNSLYYRWQALSLAWKRFAVTARRYALSPQETYCLRRLIRKAKLSNPNRILLEQEPFENLVLPYEERGRRSEQLHIQSIRQKLFGRSLRKNERIRSTHDLPVGSHFLIQSLDGGHLSLRGNLVDVDEIGLIVVLSADPPVRIALRPGSNLEITTTVADSPPILFRTWIKSVIPGPRRMIVLGHSSFVLEKRRRAFGEKIVGPQDRDNEPHEPFAPAPPHRPNRLSR